MPWWSSKAQEKSNFENQNSLVANINMESKWMIACSIKWLIKRIAEDVVGRRNSCQCVRKQPQHSEEPVADEGISPWHKAVTESCETQKVGRLKQWQMKCRRQQKKKLRHTHKDEVIGFLPPPLNYRLTRLLVTLRRWTSCFTSLLLPGACLPPCSHCKCQYL